ncbi:hypothetical protein JX266_004768 [Neoarthrinium moseri]|nr:hypothetical protein JX266_004768 [Neoarthrinium moseri]
MLLKYLTPKSFSLALIAGLAIHIHASYLDYPTTSSARQQCALDIPVSFQHGSYRMSPLPLDDTTLDLPSSYSPWTHPPACLTSLLDSSEKYCIYTNDGQGSNGVSIITRPSLAAASAAVLLNEKLSDHFAARAGRNDSHLHLLPSALPGSPSSSVPVELPYEIVNMPGKGKGVLATRRIRKAEVLMLDHASLLVAAAFPGSVRQVDGYEILHRAADQLRDPGRVLGLGRSSKGAADVLEDVIRTNSFAFDLGGEPHMAVYPEISRINHGCNPNAFARFLPHSLAASIIAFRDIEPGEEITISYIPFARPTSERQALLSRWNFNCTCALCASSPSTRASSDYRRTKIRSLREEILEAIGKRDGTRAVTLSHEVLRLAQIEKLEPLYGETYNTIARIYWHAGDKRTAERYARLSLRTLGDQGYIDDREEHLETLLKTFEEP